nr:hypothetical protein [uncultured Rhodopila sp.]
MKIPEIVHRDLREAVESAILFGVSAREFMVEVAQHWDDALAEKRRFDAQTFAEAVRRRNSSQSPIGGDDHG